jgi:hypothetical protein
VRERGRERERERERKREKEKEKERKERKKEREKRERREYLPALIIPAACVTICRKKHKITIEYDVSHFVTFQ